MTRFEAIRIRGLRHRFGALEVLSGMDLDVVGPGVHGFLGVNGAGKSTTMRILNGFLRPSEGEVRLLGEPVGPDLLGVRRSVGYLAQQPAFHPWMTGQEVLQLTADLYGMDRQDGRTRASALLERLDLAAAARRRVGGYSGGMKQRLGLAAALLPGPRLLLLDEPVSALDPVGRAGVLDLIASLGREVTVFMSTHILADVERVCDHITILHGGRVLASEATDSLRRRFIRPVFRLAVGAGAEDLAGALRREAWVHDVAVNPIEGGTELRIHVRDTGPAPVRIPALVASLGLPMHGLVSETPDLEAVFMRIVGDGKGVTA